MLVGSISQPLGLPKFYSYFWVHCQFSMRTIPYLFPFTIVFYMIHILWKLSTKREKIVESSACGCCYWFCNYCNCCWCSCCFVLFLFVLFFVFVFLLLLFFSNKEYYKKSLLLQYPKVKFIIKILHF